MKTLPRRTLLLTALLGLSGGFALAQEATQPRPGGALAATARNTTDAQLATLIAIGNEGEIALGKWMQDRTENRDVKKFAKLMVDEHTDFLGQLQKHGGFRREVVTERGKVDADPRPAASTPTLTAAGHLDWVVFHHELGEKCIESSMKELSKKKGAELDKFYVGMQIGAHKHMLDLLTVSRKHASGELRKVIDEGLSATEKHLDHAKDLMHNLEGGSRDISASPDREE